MPQIKPSNPIIDWGNPITKGLVFDAPFYEGAGLKPKELVTGNEFAMSGSTWKKGLYGNSLHIDGTNTNQKATLTSKSIQDGIDKISIQIISRNSENASRVIDKRGASFRFAVIYGGAPDYRMIFYAGFSGSTPNWATPNNSWAIGDAHNFVATYDFTSTSNDPLLYMDGAQTTVTEVVAPSGSANADGSTITIGNRPASDVGNNQDVFLVRYWNRILTPTEIKLLSSDPWCIYQKPRFNIINSISSAVTGLRGLISFGMIPFGMAETGISATGGTITEVGGYKIHTFTTDGTFEITAGTGDVEYLVVAGGGGGAAGGGGAGGLLTGTKTAMSVGTYTVTVGDGGTYGNGYQGGLAPTNGEDSVFDDITAIGGGKGGYNVGGTITAAGTGGSGGGGSYDDAALRAGGAGTTGQGYAGGANGNLGNPYPSGGGGGASEVGADGAGIAGGDGGDGIQSSINGTPTYYAGGGGGSGYSTYSAGVGGLGGGGTGTLDGGANANGSAGTANTGGGGGGCNNGAHGGNGGSGIVIVRYAI